MMASRFAMYIGTTMLEPARIYRMNLLVISEQVLWCYIAYFEMHADLPMGKVLQYIVIKDVPCSWHHCKHLLKHVRQALKFWSHSDFHPKLE